MDNELNLFDVLQLARATMKVHQWDVERTIECMKDTFKDRLEEKQIDMLECCLIEDELKTHTKDELFEIACDTNQAIKANCEWSQTPMFGLVKSKNLLSVCKSIILN